MKVILFILSVTEHPCLYNFDAFMILFAILKYVQRRSCLDLSNPVYFPIICILA